MVQDGQQQIDIRHQSLVWPLQGPAMMLTVTT